MVTTTMEAPESTHFSFFSTNERSLSLTFFDIANRLSLRGDGEGLSYFLLYSSFKSGVSGSYSIGDAEVFSSLRFYLLIEF